MTKDRKNNFQYVYLISLLYNKPKYYEDLIKEYNERFNRVESTIHDKITYLKSNLLITKTKIRNKRKYSINYEGIFKYIFKNYLPFHKNFEKAFKLIFSRRQFSGFDFNDKQMKRLFRQFFKIVIINSKMEIGISDLFEGYIRHTASLDYEECNFFVKQIIPDHYKEPPKEKGALLRCSNLNEGIKCWKEFFLKHKKKLTSNDFFWVLCYYYVEELQIKSDPIKNRIYQKILSIPEFYLKPSTSQDSCK